MADPEDPVEPYGASLADVRAFLPHRRIDGTTKPTDAQARQFLVITTDRIAGRLGLVAGYTPELQEAAGKAAAGIAAQGAAALVENAGAPERAGKQGTGYGDWLWSEYLKAIDELLEELGKATSTDAGAGAPAVVGRPAGSFPPPIWRRDTGF